MIEHPFLMAAKIHADRLLVPLAPRQPLGDDLRDEAMRVGGTNPWRVGYLQHMANRMDQLDAEAARKRYDAG